MGYYWKAIKFSEGFTINSQKEKFPFFMNPKDVFGLKIQVNAHVFSPKYAQGYKYFIPALPEVTNLSVLEVGSGHGIVSCFLAKSAKKVVAVDINSYAVENTKINAHHNNLRNLEARESNVFSNIRKDEKFDLIFWNIPWAKIPDNYRNLNPEDYGVFDVEHNAVSEFIIKGKDFLNPGGFIYLFFGTEGADVNQIESIIKKAKLKKEVIAKFIIKEKSDKEEFTYNTQLIRLN